MERAAGKYIKACSSADDHDAHIARPPPLSSAALHATQLSAAIPLRPSAMDNCSLSACSWSSPRPAAYSNFELCWLPPVNAHALRQAKRILALMLPLFVCFSRNLCGIPSLIRRGTNTCLSTSRFAPDMAVGSRQRALSDATSS